MPSGQIDLCVVGLCVCVFSPNAVLVEKGAREDCKAQTRESSDFNCCGRGTVRKRVRFGGGGGGRGSAVLTSMRGRGLSQALPRKRMQRGADRCGERLRRGLNSCLTSLPVQVSEAGDIGISQEKGGLEGGRRRILVLAPKGKCPPPVGIPLFPFLFSEERRAPSKQKPDKTDIFF